MADRVELPKSVNKKMDLWRQGLTPIPQEYIDFHKDLANKSLAKLPLLKVHSVRMEDDGWCDGMQFLHAVVETPNGELHKIKWCDSQHWMSRCKSGGWGFFRT